MDAVQPDAIQARPEDPLQEENPDDNGVICPSLPIHLAWLPLLKETVTRRHGEKNPATS